MTGGRPNLVIVMADQLRADAVGCFGNAQTHAPAIDALAARGTRFADAWVQHPVCGPSRVSFMTGWYPHTAGHRTFDNLVEPWEPNLLAMLRDDPVHAAVSSELRTTVFEHLAETSDVTPWNADPRFPRTPQGWRAP